MTLDPYASPLLAERHDDTQIFFYLLIGCSLVSSCYTLVWDLKMDWGLFDRNAGDNTILREEIVYPQKVSVHLLVITTKMTNISWVEVIVQIQKYTHTHSSGKTYASKRNREDVGLVDM